MRVRDHFVSRLVGAGALASALALSVPASVALAKAPAASQQSSGAKSAKLGKVAKLDRSKIPDGGASPHLAMPKPTRFKLSSGADVLVVERHELPMVSVMVVWPRGIADEKPEKAGLALMTAGMLDEGTAKHGPLQLAEAIDGLGAQLGSFANWDFTAVSLTSLKRNLDGSLGLLAEVVGEPAFDEKELERVRGETLTSMLQRKDAASVVASDVFSRTLYGSRRYGMPAIGTEETIKGIARADIAGWYLDNLRPELATLVVAGDVTPAEAKAALEKALAGWKAGGDKSAAVAAAAIDLPKSRRVLVDKPSAPQSEVRLGLPGVPRNSPDFFPLVVMNEILGGGEFSNRLNLNLREAHAYTYGAHSAFAFRRDGGPFVASAATKTAVTGEAVREAFSELMRIRSAPVQNDELRLAKDGLVRGEARRFATLGDVTGELAAQVVYQLPDDYFATFGAKVEAVTAADVQRVASQYLDPAKLSVVIVGDRQAVNAQLTSGPLGIFDEVDATGKLVEPKTVKAVTTPAPAAPAKPAK